VTEHQGATPPTTPDGLWRWLLGGLAAGGIILGLLIASYAIGYHRGRHHRQAAASTTTRPIPPATTARATTTASTAAASPAPAPIQATPALVARGKALYTSDGCSGCHSLTGSAGAGPSLKGLAGATVTLTTGQTVTADDAYLERSISDPDTEIVKGYNAGIMSAAIASFDLAGKPDDLRALVAFIEAQK
jgi:mono/diheme cytochrome c family protein